MTKLSDYAPGEIEKARQSILKRRTYYLKNRDEKLAYGHQSYQENEAEKREYGHQYYQDNKSKLKEQSRQRYQDNKDSVLEQRRQHYQNNKDKYAAHNQQYNREHKEEAAARNRRYNQDNKDKVLEQKRRYRQEHPEVDKAAHHKRRAWKEGSNNGHFTAEEFKLLCEAFENKCFYCKQELPSGPDHLTPLSRGGDNTIDNIVPACRFCNSRKSNKTLDEYMKSLEDNTMEDNAHGVEQPV